MPDIPISHEIVGEAAARMRQEDPRLPMTDAWEKSKKLRLGEVDNDSLKVSCPEGEGAEESRDIM